MKYIIMCGGNYHSTPKGLRAIKGETFVARTIRLLKENGVTDISISSNDDRFEKFGVPVLRHSNTFGDGGHWLEGFYPTVEPACYIFGDVFFSPVAIKTIVNTETDSIEFFASPERCLFKRWAEPYAFKVNDQVKFQMSIHKTIMLAEQEAFKREPISWELWQVIKGTPLNQINYHNYKVIDDYSCDIDSDEEYESMKEKLEGVGE